MTSPPRIPKGSKEGGRSPAKPKRDASVPEWAGLLDAQYNHLADHLGGLIKIVGEHSQSLGELKALQESTESATNDLSSRLGTSTPLIIWNIAVLIALAGLGVAVARLYGYAPY